MENIIFEDPSRRIVHQKRAKSSSFLKKDTSDLPIFHEQYTARPTCPYPPRDQLEKGVSGSMTSCSVGDRTDSHPEDHESSSGHEPQNREADVVDDDNSDAPIRDITVRLGEQATVQPSPKPPAKSDTHRSKQRRRALSKAPSVTSDSEELGSDFEDSKSDAETDGDEALGDRWEYTRIVARRIDSSGRRMAKVRWKDTWEPEGELKGLETALLLDTKRRQREEQSSKEICLKCGARKRKHFA